MEQTKPYYRGTKYWQSAKGHKNLIALFYLVFKRTLPWYPCSNTLEWNLALNMFTIPRNKELNEFYVDVAESNKTSVA